MHEISESLRLPSPAPKPQSIAFDGEHLWMGSVETDRLYALDPNTWTVSEEAAAPGKPWGMAVVGDELRVVCGETAEDNRIIRRFVPGHGFKTRDAIACPDDTGSQLGYDGERLYLSQFYNRQILALDDHGTVTRTIPVPHQICGQVVVDGRFYLITTDEENKHDDAGKYAYFLTRVDARNGNPHSEDIATIPFPARGLAWDGSRFWTNHRENHEIVAFDMPA